MPFVYIYTLERHAINNYISGFQLSIQSIKETVIRYFREEGMHSYRSFLNNGINLSVFKHYGKIPDQKDMFTWKGIGDIPMDMTLLNNI